MPWIIDVFDGPRNLRDREATPEDLQESHEFETKAGATHWMNTSPVTENMRRIGPYWSPNSRPVKPELNPNRERLLAIAAQILEVQREVLYEKGKYKDDDWLNLSPEELGFRACEEVVELVNSRGRSKMEKRREAADAKNFIDMICDLMEACWPDPAEIVECDTCGFRAAGSLTEMEGTGCPHCQPGILYKASK